MRVLPALLAAALAAPLAGCGVFGSDDADLQVYSGRHYDLEEAFSEFEDETGISVEFLNGEDAEMLERIRAEGEDTPADILMTVDAGNLWKAAQDGLVQPLDSPVLDEAVPADLRDPQDRWVGLSMRARTVVYDPDTVDPAEFDTEDTYAGLADPQWRGRLCMRDSTSSYTQSLIAGMIDTHGYDGALDIVRGWVDNGVDIMPDDITILETIDAGGCDVALTNHYYLARLLDENPDLDVKLFWANQDGRGVHVNVSGAGVVADSDNPEQAQQLIEWLATDGQSAFVDGNHEFPVNPAVEPEPLIAAFGDFTYEPLNAEAYGDLNAQAIDLMAEAGYE